MRLVTKDIREKINAEIQKNLTKQSKERIIHYLLTDKQFAELTINIISPELFSKEYQNIVKTAQELFIRYKQPPQDLVLNELDEKDKLLASSLLSLDPKDSKQYLLDKLLEIYRVHISTVGLSETQTILEKMKNDSVNAISYIDSIIRLWTDIRIETTKNEEYGIELSDTDKLFTNNFLFDDPQKIIVTGYKSLDDRLIDGIKSGDVVVFQAPTGVGKSMIMMNIAINQILMGKNILYITLELNEKQTMKRLVQILSNNSPNVFHHDKDNLMIALDNYFKEYNSKLGRARVVYATPNKFSATDVQFLLHKLRMLYDFEPDVVFIDYVDYLKPSKSYKEYRFELKQIYLDIQELSDEIALPIITASQSNRQGAKKEKVDNEDISEGYAKSQIADVMIGISRVGSTDSNSSDYIRLKFYISKSRLGPSNIPLDFVQNKATTRVRENPDVEVFPIDRIDGFSFLTPDHSVMEKNRKGSLFTGGRMLEDDYAQTTMESDL